MPKKVAGKSYTKNVKVTPGTKLILDQLKIDWELDDYDEVILHAIMNSPEALKILKKPKEAFKLVDGKGSS